ncbi:MAG TPA: kelch repeat-containing protein [Candidatus Limnocylindrales bacterium]
MSGRDVENELTEFFRHTGTPRPSAQLRGTVVAARLGPSRRRTFASGTPRAALSLLGLAASIVLAGGLLLVVSNRVHGPGNFGAAASASESPAASASESPAANASPSEGAIASPIESPDANPVESPTAQPPATPKPAISFGPSGAFSPAGSMGADYTIATILSDGRILFTGAGEGDLTSAKLYDPATGHFSPTGSTLGPHNQGAATRLLDGRVLVLGGVDIRGGNPATAELYDPATGKFSLSGSLPAGQSVSAVALLMTGQVLVVGTTMNGQTMTASAELYDPGSGTFRPTGALSAARISSTLTLLPDGRVLVAGGYDGCCTTQTVASAETYDPTTGIFSATGPMKSARAGHAATLLPGGRVLITGGSNGSVGVASAELYDPGTGKFSPAGSMTADREYHASTLLADDRVLIAGGMHDPGPVACAGAACIAMVGTTDLTSAEIYDPATGKFTRTGSMATPRTTPIAVTLWDGRVLVAGGFTNQGPWTDAELYQP